MLPEADSIAWESSYSFSTDCPESFAVVELLFLVLIAIDTASGRFVFSRLKCALDKKACMLKPTDENSLTGDHASRSISLHVCLGHTKPKSRNELKVNAFIFSALIEDSE